MAEYLKTKEELIHYIQNRIDNGFKEIILQKEHFEMLIKDQYIISHHAYKYNDKEPYIFIWQDCKIKKQSKGIQYIFDLEDFRENKIWLERHIQKLDSEEVIAVIDYIYKIKSELKPNPELYSGTNNLGF